MSIIVGMHELNRTLAVWRPDPIEDGAGGQDVEYLEVGEIRAQVSQPTAAERVAANQAGAELSHIIHARPDVDVRRGDELRGDGEAFRVKAVIVPSSPLYLRIEAERVQAESEPGSGS